MKQFFKFFFGLMLFVFLVSPATNGLSKVTGFSIPVATVLVVAAAIVLQVLSAKQNDRLMRLTVFNKGVEKQQWVDYIIKRFYKDNKFMNCAYNDDQYVLGGAAVHIPQQGVKPVVQKNRSVFPAVAVRRTDGEVFYGLDNYTTDPTHVPNAEKMDVSYNKLDDVYGDHIGAIAEAVADDMIVTKWATGAPVLRTQGIMTLGEAGVTTAATADGATGLRLLTTHRDVRMVNKTFNKSNVPQEDRYGLLDEEMADQIFESLSDTKYRQFSAFADPSTGVLGKLYNINLMTRSSVAAADNTGAIKAIGAAGAATDNAVSLFWQKNSVARALGTVAVYDDTDNPLYYGDIISSELRAGGRVRRADYLGILNLVQANA